MKNIIENDIHILLKIAEGPLASWNKGTMGGEKNQ